MSLACDAAGRQFHRPTPASPQLHGGRVVRATTPDPLSPTGYRRTIDVRFPDDDLLDDPDLDEVKRVRRAWTSDMTACKAATASQPQADESVPCTCRV